MIHDCSLLIISLYEEVCLILRSTARMRSGLSKIQDGIIRICVHIGTKQTHLQTKGVSTETFIIIGQKLQKHLCINYYLYDNTRITESGV